MQTGFLHFLEDKIWRSFKNYQELQISILCRVSKMARDNKNQSSDITFFIAPLLFRFLFFLLTDITMGLSVTYAPTIIFPCESLSTPATKLVLFILSFKCCLYQNNRIFCDYIRLYLWLNYTELTTSSLYFLFLFLYNL